MVNTRALLKQYRSYVGKSLATRYWTLIFPARDFRKTTAESEFVLTMAWISRRWEEARERERQREREGEGEGEDEAPVLPVT